MGGVGWASWVGVKAREWSDMVLAVTTSASYMRLDHSDVVKGTSHLQRSSLRPKAAMSEILFLWGARAVTLTSPPDKSTPP